jgi:hypothetical protein
MASFPRNRATPAGRSEQNPFTVYRRAFKTNQTTDAIVLSVPTTTQPTTATAGVHELEPGRGVLIKPYGTDTDDDEFRIAVQIWHPMYDRLEVVRTSEDVVWIPTTIYQGDCLIGSDTVAAGTVGPLVVGDMFANDIAKPTGTNFNSLQSIGGSANEDDLIHTDGDVPTKYSTHVTLQTWGARYIQFFIDIDGGGGTAAVSGNALFAVI